MCNMSHIINTDINLPHCFEPCAAIQWKRYDVKHIDVSWACRRWKNKWNKFYFPILSNMLKVINGILFNFWRRLLKLKIVKIKLKFNEVVDEFVLKRIFLNVVINFLAHPSHKMISNQFFSFSIGYGVTKVKTK